MTATASSAGHAADPAAMPPRRSAAARLWHERADMRLAVGLFVVLVVLNLVVNPGRYVPSNWGTVIGLAAPLMLATLAITVPFLAGRGSIDVSVGPLVGLVNVTVVQWLILDHGVSSPWVIVPFALGLGIASGVLNGWLAAILRIQPIVATLGTYLLYSGVALAILPSPAGSVPPWLTALSGTWSFLPVAAAVLIWLVVKRLPYHELLMATGSDDRAAYTAGVAVPWVRFFAYVLAGIFAGLAGLSLTALIGSGDATIGPTYTLIAVAAAALGGVSLAGGVGGLAAALIGAADIFLLQSLLTAFNVSTFVLQMAYGAILVAAICLNAEAVKTALGIRGPRP